LQHTVSENQQEGILLETFNLEAFKFDPVNEKANISLTIIAGNECLFKFLNNM